MNASKHSSNITRVLSTVILGICCKPEDCLIEEAVRIGELSIKVTPNVSDYALLCGRKGRTVRAFKHLTDQAGLLEHKLAGFELVALIRGDQERAPGFVQNPQYDITDAIAKARSLWELVCPYKAEFYSHLEADKLKVYITPEASSFGTEPLIAGIGDVLYPYGYRKGMLIDVKKGHADNRVGTGQVLGNR